MRGVNLLTKLLTFFLFIFSAWYTRDLVQVNHPHLFLDSKQLQHSQKIKAEFNLDRPNFFLILNQGDHLTEPEKNENIWRKSHEILKNIREEFREGVEILLPWNFYTPFLKINSSWRDAQEFILMHPEMPWPLIGGDWFGGVINMQPTLPPLKAQAILDRIRSQFKRENLHLLATGMEVTNAYLNFYSADIQTKIFPVLFLFCFLMTWFICRHLRIAVILFFPSVLGTLLSLALVKYFFHYLNMITSIVPLMVFVISYSIVYHFYFALLELGSWEQCVRAKLKPTLLMVVTTVLGFFSLVTSPLDSIVQFSLISSGMILTSFVINFFWLKSFSTYVLKNGNKSSFFLLGIEKIWLKTLNKQMKPWWVLIASFVAIIVSLVLFQRVEVLTDANEYFPKNSGIRQEGTVVAEKFGGDPLLEIYFHSSKEFDVSIFKKLLEIETKIDQKFIEVRRSISASSLMAQANGIYSGNFNLPEQDISFWSLKSQVQNHLKTFLTSEGGYRLILLGPTLNGPEYKKLVNEVKSTLGQILSDHQLDFISFEVGGLQYDLMEGQDAIIETLAKSFFLTFLVISILVFPFLKNLKFFSLFIFINLVPLLLTLGFMPLFGASLNAATVMTFSIAMGMIVDGTIHILFAYGRSEGERDIFKMSIRPTILSSLFLFFAFAFLGFHQFLPIRDFGLMLAMGLGLGLLYDVVFLPQFFQRKA